MRAVIAGLLLIIQAATVVGGSDVGAAVRKLSSTHSDERQAAIAELMNVNAESMSKLIQLESDLPHDAQVLQTIHRLIAVNQISKLKLQLVSTTEMSSLKSKKIDSSILFDRKSRMIAIPATFKIRFGELEYLTVDASPSAPVHETLLAAAVKPSELCLALLVCGYSAFETLAEAQYAELPPSACVRLSVQFEFAQPHAAMIDDLTSKRAELKPADPKFVSTVRVPIEAFVHNSGTRRAMRIAPYVFTGSEFSKSAVTERVGLAADFEGPIAALKFNPVAVLNSALNTRAIDPQRSPGYQINRFTVPESGTKCFLILEPWGEQKLTEADLNDKPARESSERP